MLSTWDLFDAVAVALLVYIVRRFLVGSRPGHSLPPGPPGWPIIGNVFDMPTKYQYETFAKWGEKWGAPCLGGCTSYD